LPPYPTDALRAVQSAIVTAGEPDAQKLAGLLAFSQIHHSRLRDFDAKLRSNMSGGGSIIMTSHFLRPTMDAVSMYFHAERAFEYGRGRELHIGVFPDADSACSKLALSLGWESTIVFQYIREHWLPEFAEDEIQQ
jgi:hypothetical protein